MKLKDSSVNLDGVSWRMWKAAIIAEAVYAQFGAQLVITSAKDGKHGPKSLHYEGLALDLRTNNLGGREASVHAELSSQLGPEFDCVLEKDHIHIEYDAS